MFRSKNCPKKTHSFWGRSNVWFIKIRTTPNLSLWLYEYFWIILLYGHLVCFILKLLAWEICNMKWGFAKKVIIKSQRQFSYGSNFYESDVMYILPLSWVTLFRQKIQTAVETDKFTKVHQRMAMFDSVCNWDGFYSESCLRFALEKHC